MFIAFGAYREESAAITVTASRCIREWPDPDAGVDAATPVPSGNGRFQSRLHRLHDVYIDVFKCKPASSKSEQFSVSCMSAESDTLGLPPRSAWRYEGRVRDRVLRFGKSVRYCFEDWVIGDKAGVNAPQGGMQ